MSRRIKKQLIYGAMYLAVAGGIAGGVYILYLKPAPSCFDKIQNQGEFAVDCGGPCSRVCSPTVQSIQPIELVGQVLRLEPDAGHVSLLAKIINQNSAYAARSFSYQFSLYDERAAVVKSVQGTSFIYPGETKYILAPNIPRVDFGRIDFSIENSEWVSALGAGDFPKVITTSVERKMLDNKFIVEGAIVNRDIFTVPKVTILAAFIGNLGEIAGASETEITDLVPGETKRFLIFHPRVDGIDLGATKIFSYSKQP